MALTFTGSGGLFTKIGHILGILLDVNAARGSALTAPDYTTLVTSKVDTLAADYAAGTAQRTVAEGLYTQRTSWQSAQASWLSYLQQLAQNTVIDAVKQDNPQPDSQLRTAMTEVIRQMTGSYNVTASTVTAGSQTAVGSPTGTAVVVTSVKDGKGLALDYALAETLTFACTADSQSGSATAGQEPVSVKGQAAVTDQLSQSWPAGSGTSVSLNAVAAAQNANGNLLWNSDFEDWTNADTPDNWIALVGTVTTNYRRGSSAHGGSYSLELRGDGSALVSLAQTFNTTTSTTLGSGGTTSRLYPRTPYACNFYYKLASSSPAAGVLEVSLIDGSGTIIQDDQGADNKTQITLTSVADTSWHNASVVFRLPAALPTTIKLRVRQSTVLSAGNSVFVDDLALATMTQLYAGGPYAAVFSGSTNLIAGDSWTVAITNSWGNFQQGCQRLFDLRSLGLRLPTTGGSAIDDTVGSGHLIS